jgi:hypothetical protein
MESTGNNRTWTEDWSADEADLAPLRPMSRAGVELNQLNRYGLVLAMLALCALLSTWSSIDLRATSVALDGARSGFSSAESERARLQLELASLSDPGWLSSAAATLSLESGAEVIHLQAPGSP